MQQGDVKLFHTADGGEIDFDGLFTMDGGLETAAYLALFGGNEDDTGLADDANQWWGNEQEPAAQAYRSETQNLLRSMPIIPANLRRLEDAARRDLAFFISEKIANTVEVAATMPALNTVAFDVTITAEGSESQFEFAINWQSSFSSDEITEGPISQSVSAGLRLLLENGEILLLESAEQLLLEE